MGFFNHMASKIKQAITAVKSGEALRTISTVCKRAVTKVKRAVFKTKKLFRALDWEQLLRNIWDRFKDLLQALWRWIKEHPYLFAFIVVCILVAIIVPAVMPAALGAAGFGAAGPVAGSAAASFQATTGGIAAGSMFAILQSAAMGGYGLAIVVAGPSIVAGVAAALALMWAYFDGRKEGREGHEHAHQE